MKSIGQMAYEAYCQSSGGKSLISGQPLPSWKALDRSIKRAWDAAAEAVAAHCMGMPKKKGR